jgi:hypothetical protein
LGLLDGDRQTKRDICGALQLYRRDELLEAVFRDVDRICPGLQIRSCKFARFIGRQDHRLGKSAARNFDMGSDYDCAGRVFNRAGNRVRSQKRGERHGEQKQN